MKVALMRQFNIHYFYWSLTRLFKKSGIFGLLGISLILACGVFYVAKLMPLNKQVESLNSALAQNQSNARFDDFTTNNSNARDSSAKSSANSGDSLSQSQLEKTKTTITKNQEVLEQDIKQFYALFPAGANLPQFLETIAQTAVKHGLKLNRGDYKLSAQQLAKTSTVQNKQGQFSRYEIVLPVTGQYVQIKKFISKVLQLIPALALGDLQIKRATTTSPVVEARLVFVLILQGDAW